MTQRIGEVVQVRWNELFTKMQASAGKQNPFVREILLNTVLIGIDPGETTGFAYYLPWVPGVIHLTQVETKDVVQGAKSVIEAIPNLTYRPATVICEDYRVYAWKADSHAWAGLHTPQLIGALRFALDQREFPVGFQMAVEAKRFATDDMLTKWGMYARGMKHARDAQRHIINWMFFGKPEKLGH